MAVVTGYTAEKMNQFNNQSVVSGSVNSAGSLILTTRGGTSIDAGNVKGPKGDTGTITTAQLAPYIPKWKSGTAYTVGTQVISPGPSSQILTCISAHTSATTFSTDYVTRWSSAIFAGTTTERDAIFGSPTTDAAIVALANKQVRYYNTTEGWWESYYSTAKTGLTAKNLIAGNTVGWYPEAGSDIRAHCGIQNSFQRVEANTTIEPVMGDLLLNTKNRFTKRGNSGIGVPFGGFYRLFASAYMSGSISGNIVVSISVAMGTTIIRGSNNKPNSMDVEANVNGLYPFNGTDTIRTFIYSADGVSCWGTTGYNGTRLTVEYAGPPLSN